MIEPKRLGAKDRVRIGENLVGQVGTWYAADHLNHMN